MNTMRLSNDTARTAAAGSPVVAHEPAPGTTRQPAAGAGTATPHAAGITAGKTGQPAATTASSQPETLDLAAVLEHVGEFISPQQRSLAFEIHEELGRAIVSVYDVATEELIRQIPPEEMLRIATVMREFAEQGEQRPTSGLLLDAQA